MCHAVVLDRIADVGSDCKCTGLGSAESYQERANLATRRDSLLGTLACYHSMEPTDV
jgi:hypothetical protein